MPNLEIWFVVCIINIMVLLYFKRNHLPINLWIEFSSKKNKLLVKRNSVTTLEICLNIYDLLFE